MKVPEFILAALLVVLIAVNGWILTEIVSLKVSVAMITERISHQKLASNER